MKFRFLLAAILMICCCPVLAKGKKGGRPKLPIHPIQNDTGVWTFGVEANVYQGTSYLQPIIAYSARGGWDFAITSQNIPVYGGGAQNYQDDTYFILAKTFKWNKSISTIAGAMGGYALYTEEGSSLSPGDMHKFAFIDNEFRLTKYLKLHGGSFWANAALSTTTSYFGGLAGLELMYGPFSFRADYFGGHSNVSGATATIDYFPVSRVNLYAGIGVPERESGNEFYGIVGFQLSTGSLR